MSKHLAVASQTVTAASASPPSEIAGIADLSVRKPSAPNAASPAVTVELIATIALALSTLVAITVVSIGIARAATAPLATVLLH